MKSGSTNWQPAQANRESQGLCGDTMRMRAAGACRYRDRVPISSLRLVIPRLRGCVMLRKASGRR